MNAGQHKVTLHCETCGKQTAHMARCEGGARLKTYLTCFEGRNWEGDVQPMDISASYADGSPVTEADGRLTHSKYKSGFDDRMRARKDRKRSDRLRRDGGGSMFFDQKR